MNVAILGCGPAGLLAAYAAERLGATVHIYSIRQKSVLGGAQYLHARIPGLSNVEQDTHINYYKLGTREGYAAKVYGDPDAPCSWDSFPQGFHRAWSLKSLYDQLWDRYSEHVVHRRINSAELRALRTSHDLVFSSIPAPRLCLLDCHFNWEEITIREAALPGLPNNTIEYNGEPNIPYYRTSLIMDAASTEYGRYGFVRGDRLGIKPLSNGCDCFPDVVRVGRFGTWTKGVLVHDAYYEARKAVNALL